MAAIESYAQWTVFINKLATDLRSTANAIQERNQAIQSGTPKAQLARQHAYNQRSLRTIEGIAFLFFS